MVTIKKILNTNVVLVEKDHHEFILLGKGIGYGKKPGAIIEEHQDNELFMPIDNEKSKQMFELLNSIPIEILELTQEIIQDAKGILHTTFQNNLYFVLADHLNFAIERMQKQMVITNRVFWEIKSFYPKEFEAGVHSIALVKEKLHIELPEEEAANIAFHFANAQSGDNPDYDTARYAKLIGEIINLVRYSLNRDFDLESIHYLRFVTHIKFFVERFYTDKMLHNGDHILYHQMQTNYPKEMDITMRIKSYLYDKYQKLLPEEELVFLAIHINRISRTDN